MTDQAQKIQALLFVAGEAVSKQELAKLIKSSVEEIDAYIEEIGQALAGQGLAIAVTNTHAQLTTAPHVAEYLAAFQSQEAEALTRAAAETLALIAYRGPISRYDVDAVRGVDSRSMIRSLVRRGIVRQVQAAGRTPLYDVTEDFLLQLGITKRQELPEFESLSTNEAVARVLDQEDNK